MERTRVTDSNEVFTPDRHMVEQTQLTAFMRHCEKETNSSFPDQESFYLWTVKNYEHFWLLFLQWSNIVYEGAATPICTSDNMETAEFLPAVRLNFVENLLRCDESRMGHRPALVAYHADSSVSTVTREALRNDVIRCAQNLRQLGVRAGDRVVAISVNDERLITVGLAILALGATMSTAAPDMGASAIMQRFGQLEPSVLVVDFGTKSPLSRDTQTERVAAVLEGLPQVKYVLNLGSDSETGSSHLLDDLSVPSYSFENVLAALPDGTVEDFVWPKLPFNHPLFILFSSGTTGPPKCIVHGAGGVLLEHLKEHLLHGDLRSEDVLFFQTSPAWMMWNWQLSALATGAAVVLFDGPVSQPDDLWRVVDAESVTSFGTSPAFLQLCANLRYSPASHYPLQRLRRVLSTGSILPDALFDWSQEAIGNIPLQSISGGTDIVGCFVLGSPNLPVLRGYSQCRSLGLDVKAANASPDTSIGDLVCCNPFPSRPLRFYNDPGGAKFHEAYFAANPGVWTHGDLIEITPNGTARMHGRNDGIMNVAGIRIGPAEIYRVLHGITNVSDCLAVEQATPEAVEQSRIVLLVVMRADTSLDAALNKEIRIEIARQASPAHVPALIVAVPDLPTTHSGKRSERAARDALNGVRIGNVAALRNPESLDHLVNAVAEADSLIAQSGASPVAGDPVSILCALYQDVLQVSPVGPDDNFFELGGSSLVIARLFQSIHERLGTDLAMSSIFSAPTPRQLAESLREDPDVSTGMLVPLSRLDGSERVVFFIHDLTGDVLAYRRLALLLAGERSIYGIRAKGLDHRMMLDTTVEDMAESAIDALRLVQPAGPYELFGYSFGGIVAFEMAQRLMASGEEVSMLGLVDTYVGPRALGRARGVFFNVAVRQVWRVGRVLQSPPKEIKRLSNVARSRLRRGGEPTPLNQPGAPLTPLQHTVQDIADRELLRYRPQTYAGHITFFRAHERFWHLPEPTTVWRHVSKGGLSVNPVEGDHLGLMTYPTVEQLAASISRCLGER